MLAIGALDAQLQAPCFGRSAQVGRLAPALSKPKSTASSSGTYRPVLGHLPPHLRERYKTRGRAPHVSGPAFFAEG